jgi:hypothetical protein
MLLIPFLSYFINFYIYNVTDLFIIQVNSLTDFLCPITSFSKLFDSPVFIDGISRMGIEASKAFTDSDRLNDMRLMICFDCS